MALTELVGVCAMFARVCSKSKVHLWPCLSQLVIVLITCGVAGNLYTNNPISSRIAERVL